MNTKLLLATSLSSLFLLSGCSNVGGCCGYSYYDYNSQCGSPSCTDNANIAPIYSAPCYGSCYNYYTTR